ncbi:MAG: hypothetical protein IPM96_04380 [Ignavibacteria bacterium]|nr:hypothetical protein [Ignavibacteria bacterium]
MKTLKLLAAFIAVFFITVKSYSQMPPEPIKSPMIDAMLGTWISEPYEMMGSRMTDRAVHSLVLNGQYMEIDVLSKSDGFTYEGKIYIYPEKDGTMKGTMFDVFGVAGTSYTGIVDGNKVTMTGTNEMMSETREIIMDGDK